METTFMTIHNLTAEANILYASESIFEVLGYQPHEVTGRSCFEYFHPDEVPFARGIHDRGVKMDKAAVLHYAQIQGRDGQWVACECVFTVVYDVLVACTSIYRRGVATERRAADAPAIRRLFASSPRDPRYHMLEHLSAKFRAPPQQALREPRAALILNRFTRTLTVMYATNAVADILGVSPDQFKDKSFYECMQENCLPDAIRCLESAKANDSIAYLRFWYRDPRRPEDIAEEQDAAHDANHSSDSEDGGVRLQSEDQMDIDANPIGEGSANVTTQTARPSINPTGRNSYGEDQRVHSGSIASARQPTSGPSSGESTNGQDSGNQPGDDSHSSSSSIIINPAQRRQARPAPAAAPPAQAPVAEPYEIEAVVSCTSDGLVVVLRRARPRIPEFNPPAAVLRFNNGLFAAPWGANPIRPHQYQPNPQHPFQHGFEAPVVPAGGPPLDDFMASIRDVAVFAWSLAGINGNIATYGHGAPRGEAQPPSGLPVWDPYAQPAADYYPPENQAAASWAQRDAKMSSASDSGYGASSSSGGETPGMMAPRASLQRPGYFFQGPGSYTNNGYANYFGPYQVGGGSAGPTSNTPRPPTTSAPGDGSGNINPWQ